MLNLLHLLALGAVAGCLYALLGEWRGLRQSRGQLLLSPTLAFICAFVMIGLAAPDNREPVLLRSALAAGVVLGVARGVFMAIDVDQWTMVRLPSGRDGFAVALVIALAVVAAIVAPLLFAPADSWIPYATGIAALGATFLTGRAMAVYVRTRG